MDACVKCGEAVPLWAKDCPVCQTPASFPNVRVASRKVETDELERRVEMARASARARGSTGELNLFEDAVGQSRAVMNRRLDALQDWLTGQSELWFSFHRQVDAGRMPLENGWDEGRESAESTINPFVYRELNFAALSLDGAGVTSYGPFAITLRDETIEDRATAFEENPFFFNKRHKLYGGMIPPKGYRSTWAERARLAVAKLHGKIAAGTAPEAFPVTLMEDRRDEPDCDFIEVHIYGPVNRQSIARVVGQVPAKPADRLIWKSVKKRLLAQGTEVQVA